MIELRPYQERAVAEVLGHFARGTRRILLVLPTGGGKTCIASELVRRCLEMGRRSVFLAHRRELIKQTFAKLVRNGLPPTEIGVIMAGTSWRTVDAIAPDPATLGDERLWEVWARRRPPAPIQVGSIDTFRNHVHPKAGLVVVDEAHRALAKSYRDVQAHYTDGTWHLGLTATPFRADGKGLGDGYDALVVASTFGELVEQGSLVAPRCFGSKMKADLSGVRKSGTDYNAEDLARAADRAELVGDIVEHWKTLGGDAPTFCFAINVAHSKHLAERFVAAGIPARHVDGNTDTSERDDAVAALREGRVKVLTNCGIFCEGTDVPAVKTIILARPTLSEGLFLQQAGRGARPFDGRPFVLLDHAGCCTAFGLPQEPREYSLEGRKKRDKKSAALAVKECPTCHALVALATRVCDCGYEWPLDPPSVEPPKEKAGKLEELTPAQASRLQTWIGIVEEWGNLNASREAGTAQLLTGGWCMHQWRHRTGAQWPPKGAKIPRLTAEQLEENARRRRPGRPETQPRHSPADAHLEVWAL